MNKNLDKHDKIIKKYITVIIKNIINIENNNLITITNMQTKTDLSKLTIYLSILKNKDMILNILKLSSKKIKHELSNKIKKYKIPDIEFTLDKSIEYEIHIDKLIKKTKNEE